MNKYSRDVLYNLLESKYKVYNTKDFITLDPVCIPHRFSKKEDIEIMGFILRYWHGDSVKRLSINAPS